MAFAGVLEGTGAADQIVKKILGKVKRVGDLITATVISSIFLNIATADQYLAIILPGRMYKEAYRERGIHPKVLSRTLEDAGTLTSPLFPWNTCGAFVGSVLGVNPFAYLPYAILNWLNPIIAQFTDILFRLPIDDPIPEKRQKRFRQRLELFLIFLIHLARVQLHSGLNGL